ncbi:hypothetical protein [Methylobacterium nodulans]|uniref:hypothetical protein n=1 Tax=Methylobacterium nodulans TaxID=114616 RepID=UPI003CC78A1C
MTVEQPAPTLRALRIRNGARPDSTVAWCPYCEDVHHHGTGGGRRAAHCVREESPCRVTGYSLDVQGEAEAPHDVVPAALLAGRHRLSDALDGVSAEIRAAILRGVLGKRRAGPAFELRVDRARVSVIGESWWIDLDAFPARPELRSAPVPPSRTLSGRGLINLLAVLYGIPRGDVVMRLLHAVAPGAFDASGWLEISAAAEASIERRDAGEGGAR